MDKFLKYFENKNFVKWVLNPNADLDAYWQKYLDNNPKEAEQINNSRLIILALKSKKISDTQNREDVIFSDIVMGIKKKNKTSPIRKLVFTTLKYAAILLLFFSFGASYYYYQKANELDRVANRLIVEPVHGKSQLILATGEHVSISEKESKIEYQNNGEIIINKNDTVNYNYSTKTTKEKYNQLIVPFGKRSSITLPDGSIVHLNAGSRLVYPSTFIGSKREVYLYGEGFFEVFHNKKKPFIVKTNKQDIEVLGTKFNVSAFPTDNVVETVLAEGSVKLKSSHFSFFKDDFILKPNQKARYTLENEKVSISKVDASKYVSWHLGYINLETSELQNIVKRVERYYNIKIRLEGISNKLSNTITGKLLLKDDVETVMKVLAAATSMELIKTKESIYVLK